MDYLLSDQLGSTSVTSSYNGTKVAEVRYYPFGSDRYSTGNAHTSFRFTGQRVEDYIKLVLMGSRWYDPALGRWTSADSIIPDRYDPQSWDRFAYVRNNPVNRVDPTGHKDDGPGNTDDNAYPEIINPPPGVSVEQHYRLRTLQEYAELEGALFQLDLITDVEALERMLNTGARLYGDDTGACLRDLGIVVGGLDTNAIIPNRIGAGHPLEQYYVGYSNFLPNEGTTAFGNNLNPGGDNQVRHFMAGAAGSSGRGLFAENYLLSNEDADEDLALYRQAFAFVDYLDDNPLSSAGSWIRENLTAK